MMGSVTLWDRIKQGVVDSAAVAAEKAEYLGKIGRARLDIAETRHSIRDTFAELGGIVYAQFREGDNDIAGSSRVETLVSKVADLEDELKRREDVLDELRANEGDPTSEDSA